MNGRDRRRGSMQDQRPECEDGPLLDEAIPLAQPRSSIVVANVVGSIGVEARRLA
ncbi:MAG TPA: hypothetical protein VF488_06440 [Gemmatimonadaceae bacterium]